MSRGEDTSGIRISYSSSNVFQGCQRKFYYQKVKKVDIDPDVDDDGKALRIGKAFHHVLELCWHHKSLLKTEHFKKSFIENAVSSPTEQGLIVGMVRKYIELHTNSGLGIPEGGIEVEVGDGEDYIGYVDVVLQDINGHWYIVDLKTAARLSGSLLSRLSRDPQLNVYAYFAEQIAEKCKLDINKFQGVRYRVTTKATIKRSPKESMKEFADRVFDRVEAYDIFVPKDKLIPEKVYTHFMKLLKQMRALRDIPEDEVPQNFTYCETYFKPCEYWSRCYGKTFTANAEQYQIYDSENIPKLKIEETVVDDLDFL